MVPSGTARLRHRHTPHVGCALPPLVVLVVLLPLRVEMLLLSLLLLRLQQFHPELQEARVMLPHRHGHPGTAVTPAAAGADRGHSGAAPRPTPSAACKFSRAGSGVARSANANWS